MEVADEKVCRIDKARTEIEKNLTTIGSFGIYLIDQRDALEAADRFTKEDCTLVDAVERRGKGWRATITSFFFAPRKAMKFIPADALRREERNI